MGNVVSPVDAERDFSTLFEDIVAATTHEGKLGKLASAAKHQDIEALLKGDSLSLAAKVALREGLNTHTDLTPDDRSRVTSAFILIHGVLVAGEHRQVAETLFEETTDVYQPSLFSDGLDAHLAA